MDQLFKWLPMLSAIAIVAFDWGFLYQRLKNSPTRIEVDKMIDKKLEGHCPNTKTIVSLTKRTDNLETFKVQQVKEIATTNEDNHLLLQELRINMKRVCEKLDIDYLNGNSNK